MEENYLRQQPTSIIKIAIYGPESTGKTTLARQLAEHFKTTWAPEFAREYLQQKFDMAGTVCEPSDLMPIAAGQVRLENEALQNAHEFLFVDTCLLSTKTYADIYYGTSDPALEKAARKHKYDLFLLTDIDVPWEKDDLRDRPDDREFMMSRFEQSLIDYNKPYIKLSGNAEERLNKAISIAYDLQRISEIGLNSYDLMQMYTLGIGPETIAYHIRILTEGIAKVVLDRPATKGDGIVALEPAEYRALADYFDAQKDKLKLLKFVPASGAASRMFKFLTEFLLQYDSHNETINAYINRKDAGNLRVFLAGLEKFPFFKAVDQKLRQLYSDFNSWENDRKNFHFIKILLDAEHFDYCSKPKAILPFHRYDTHIATPLEEHLNESAFYASSAGISNLHFTVSDSHQKDFMRVIAGVRGKIEESSGNRIEITFSQQRPSTDTIAVDTNNVPFRKATGELFFRPGGHGALINNLNDLDADIIFIKNIDNVIQNHIESIALYKKALAGKLISLQSKVFTFLKSMDTGRLDERTFDEMVSFAATDLNIPIHEDFLKYTPEHKHEYLRSMLDRPIRVCGMVKNEGEPGGGPFWVRDSKGALSLQIVESSEVDLQNSKQAAILASATHFNPVDLVCATKNYKGEKFDLTDYIDPTTGFIVHKFKEGRELKAYELPGLWNGAMANWITAFVEVPLLTFNPVKTVNDLLKAPHQPQ